MSLKKTEEVAVRVEFEGRPDRTVELSVINHLREQVFGDADVNKGYLLRFPEAGDYFDFVVTDPSCFGDVYCAALDVNLKIRGVAARVLGSDDEEDNGEDRAGNGIVESTRIALELEQDGVTKEALEK